ncbi:hypothetical protein JL720_7897 [Aureococcus anophagefferens]|nr:hypothetical protein JL720_7897 [Aureococcus anophagefferens]
MRRAALLGVALGAPASLATRSTSKRTFASPDGLADLDWWTEYFGVEDTADPRDAGGLGDYVCLTRYTAYALPDFYGVHFPQSSVTATGATNLTEWRARKAASLGGRLGSYGAFMTGRRASGCPELRGRRRDHLRRDGRVAGAFAVFEVMSDDCESCASGKWPAYGADEQPALHSLDGYSAAALRARYATAASAAYASSAGGLPAAMVVQLRVAVADVDGAYAYAKRMFPTLELANGTESFSARLPTASYDLSQSASGDDVALIFARRAASGAATFDAYEAYVEALHAANLETGDDRAAGGGMDRYVDDHIRVSDDAVALDAWATAHVEHGLRYHAYNWTRSRSCPGADLSFPGGFMIYSAGVGAQSLELGTSAVDGSVYGADDLYSLDPCAASYECRVLDDDDDDFNMAPFAVFLSEQLNLTQTSALALGVYFVASVSAVSVVIVASTRIKRNHYFKVRGISRDYHRIKEGRPAAHDPLAATMPKKPVDGLYSKLHLRVTARTQLGQTVFVTGSSSGDRALEGRGEALEMVTSPGEWPVWRTKKPVIVARGVPHCYEYQLRSGDDVDGESSLADAAGRVVTPDVAELELNDVFGTFERFGPGDRTSSFASSRATTRGASSRADRASTSSATTCPKDAYLNYCKKVLWPSFHNVTDAFTKRKARIVFFLHIPFPTSQLFCSIAHGSRLLTGLVGADVVGFHAFDHARHFLNACKRLMGMPHKSVQGGVTGVEYEGRTVMVVVRHVSVEPGKILRALGGDATLREIEALDLTLQPLMAKKPKVVLAGVDSCQRLSGVALKLLAFERFLSEYPQWRGRVVLVQYALLDGTRVEDEARTSGELRKLAARINGQCAGAVEYREMPSSRLTLPVRLALWNRADALIGTAIREGHNLAPFESAFMGTAARIWWRPLDHGALKSAYAKAKRRLLLLDFGGTLVPKGDYITKVLKTQQIGVTTLDLLDERAAKALEALSNDPRTTVYVVSGATMHALHALLGCYPKLGLAAANGLCTTKPSLKTYETTRRCGVADYGTDWDAVKAAALPILRRHAARTNGSSAVQLIGDLEAVLKPYDVSVVHLDGMIEVVPGRMHKGNVVKHILNTLDEPPDFLFACGDSKTDEKMFSSKASKALFYLNDHAHVIDALAKLASACEPAS